MSKKLLKSTAVVSSMTFISRITGLVRDVIMANLLGSGAVADAFFVAFRIPNFLRRIFAEGAFSQAFVPVFSELTVHNTTEAKQLVNVSAGVLGLITLLLSLLGMLFAPQVVTVFAPGYLDHPEKFAITVESLRIMFPYLMCISLVAMSAGVLNTLNRFALPAITPVMLNVCLIVAMLVLVPLTENASKALAYGVLIAGFLQLLMQLPALHKEGYLPAPKVNFRNAAMRRIFRLMLPAMFSVSVAQINMLVNTFLASFLVTGSVSWLYYSDRLMEFPVGVFGIALATVVLPGLSKQAANASAQGFSEMLDWALRLVVLIALPASVALYLLSVPLLTAIFQYNAFTQNDVEMSALALQAFAFGVGGFIFVKVLAPGFFARQDTKTPMRIAVIAVVVNIVLSLILVRYMQHTGLALAISLAAWLNASLLFIQLLRQGVYSPQSGWFVFSLKVFIAIVVMAVCLVSLNVSDHVWYQADLWQRVSRVVVMVTVGAGSYFVTLLLLGIRPKQLVLRPSS